MHQMVRFQQPPTFTNSNIDQLTIDLKAGAANDRQPKQKVAHGKIPPQVTASSRREAEKASSLFPRLNSHQVPRIDLVDHVSTTDFGIMFQYLFFLYCHHPAIGSIEEC